jgi:hypothetical protein
VKWLGVIGTCSVVFPMPCEVARCDWDHGATFLSHVKWLGVNGAMVVVFPIPCEVDGCDWDY